jgi:truncated hemoglobin YjbI
LITQRVFSAETCAWVRWIGNLLSKIQKTNNKYKKIGFDDEVELLTMQFFKKSKIITNEQQLYDVFSMFSLGRLWSLLKLFF